MPLNLKGTCIIFCNSDVMLEILNAHNLFVLFTYRFRTEWSQLFPPFAISINHKRFLNLSAVVTGRLISKIACRKVVVECRNAVISNSVVELCACSRGIVLYKTSEHWLQWYFTCPFQLEVLQFVMYHLLLYIFV